MRNSVPHDSSTEYQPPNPIMVVPRANASLKILGSVIALVLFAFVLWTMFHIFMSPSPRHPGEQKQGEGLEQKIP
jgi:hypothetical protein